MLQLVELRYFSVTWVLKYQSDLFIVMIIFILVMFCLGNVIVEYSDWSFKDYLFEYLPNVFSHPNVFVRVGIRISAFQKIERGILFATFWKFFFSLLFHTERNADIDNTKRFFRRAVVTLFEFVSRLSDVVDCNTVMTSSVGMSYPPSRLD
jgi:hypothetical protein